MSGKGKPAKNMKMAGRMPRTGNEGKVVKRLLKDLFTLYGKELIVVSILLLLTSISNVTGSIFTPKIIDDVIKPVLSGEKVFADVSDLLLQPTK